MSAVLAFLKGLPELVSLIKELLGIFKDLGESWTDSKRTKELKDAIHHARTTKDTKRLEEFFNSKRLNDPHSSDNGRKPV